jgi:ribosomal subunit interface protein
MLILINMNIQITVNNFELTDSIKYLIEEKMSPKIDQLLKNFSPEMKTASVHIEKEKHDIFKVNFDIKLPGKEHIYSETRHKIFESAIIDLTQQIERQIKKYRQELVNYSLG